MLVNQNLRGHVFFEEIGILAELLLFERQLFVGVRVHECVVIARRIEKLHVTFFKIRFLEPFPRSKRAIQHVSGEVAFQLGPDERPALTGFHMLKFDDVKWFTIDHESDAASKISRRNHCLLPSAVSMKEKRSLSVLAR